MNIFSLLKQFKLGNALYTMQYARSNNPIPHSVLSEQEIKEYEIRQGALRLAEKIVNEHSKAFTEEVGEELTTVKCQFLVLEMSEFKHIVEAAIGMLTDEQIIKIRQGEDVIK